MSPGALQCLEVREMRRKYQRRLKIGGQSRKKFCWWLRRKESAYSVGDLQETRVRILGREDPRQEEMAIYSNILAWKILWTEDPGGLQSMRVTRSQMQLNTHTDQKQKENLPGSLEGLSWMKRVIKGGKSCSRSSQGKTENFPQNSETWMTIPGDLGESSLRGWSKDFGIQVGGLREWNKIRDEVQI